MGTPWGRSSDSQGSAGAWPLLYLYFCQKILGKNQASARGAGYKFRADYSGTQYWSDPLLVPGDVNNPVGIEVGGSAVIPSLRLSAVALAKAEGASSVARATRQSRGGEVQVASLTLLPGILAGLSNSAFADSNGEYLYFYHSDHLGTPLFLTDVSGTVVWMGEYLPFGEVFSEDTDPDGDGVDVEQPFRFPGQYEDDETGLYYNYFRDYHPELGRYVEPDPIGLAGGVNVFSYTSSSPINFVDLLGLRRKKKWMDCDKLPKQIREQAEKLKREFDKYNPIDDGKGNFPMKYGRGHTLPGGHWVEIQQLQSGLLEKIKWYLLNCQDDDDDCGGNSPITPNVLELANRPVAAPVIPWPHPDFPKFEISPETGTLAAGATLTTLGLILLLGL